MKIIIMYALLNVVAFSSSAQEFMLTDATSREYGPYRLEANMAIMNGKFTLVGISNQQFFIKGFVRGIGHTWGPFVLTNNAAIKIGQTALKVMTGQAFAQQKRKQEHDRQEVQLALSRQKQSDERERQEAEQRTTHNQLIISAYISNRFAEVTAIPESSLNKPWYVYGVDCGVTCAAMRLFCKQNMSQGGYWDHESFTARLSRSSNFEWIFRETEDLVENGYCPAIPGCDVPRKAKVISVEKYDSFIRGMVDALDERKPDLRTYGLDPPPESQVGPQ